jgi:DNA polymerase
LTDNPKKFIAECIEFLKYEKLHYSRKIPIDTLTEEPSEDYININYLKENISDKLYDKLHDKLPNSSTDDFQNIIPGNEIFSDGIANRKAQKDFEDKWMSIESLTAFNSEIGNCMKCPLGKTRTKFVFGAGNPDSDIVIIGEAPGADEDRQGLPFVGRAGKLLTDILKAIDLSRDEVFICNILKCRPPENRNPLPEEINKCEPYLFKQLELIKPKFILAVGAFAAQTLLKSKEPLGKLRGKFFDFHYSGSNARLLVTYHPAALLRNPNWKRPAWDDVKLFKKEYDKEKEKSEG